MGTYLRLLFVSAVLFTIMGMVEKPSRDVDRSCPVSTHVASKTILEGIVPSTNNAKDTFLPNVQIRLQGFLTEFRNQFGSDLLPGNQVHFNLIRNRYLAYRPAILQCACHPLHLPNGKEDPHFS